MINRRPDASICRPLCRSIRGLSSVFTRSMPMSWMWCSFVCYSDLPFLFSSLSAFCHCASCMWPNASWCATLTRGHQSLTRRSTFQLYPCCSMGQLCTALVRHGSTLTNKFSWTKLSLKKLRTYTHRLTIALASSSNSWLLVVYRF